MAKSQKKKEKYVPLEKRPYKSKGAFDDAFNKHCASDFDEPARKVSGKRFRLAESLALIEAEEVDIKKLDIKGCKYDKELDKAQLLKKLVKKGFEKGQYILIPSQKGDNKRVNLYNLMIRIRRALRALRNGKKLDAVSIYRIVDLGWKKEVSPKYHTIVE